MEFHETWGYPGYAGAAINLEKSLGWPTVAAYGKRRHVDGIRKEQGEAVEVMRDALVSPANRALFARKGR